jgi:hypothetical protein
LPLQSLSGDYAADRYFYSTAFDMFRSIFDAAAIGQYLGGIDPRNTSDSSTIGFINESAVYDPRKLYLETGIDEKGRKCYYARSQMGLWRINNLHIHSKNLTEFAS